MRSFGKSNFKEKFDYNLIYPSIHDAVCHILSLESSESSGSSQASSSFVLFNENKSEGTLKSVSISNCDLSDSVYVKQENKNAYIP